MRRWCIQLCLRGPQVPCSEWQQPPAAQGESRSYLNIRDWTACIVLINDVKVLIHSLKLFYFETMFWGLYTPLSEKALKVFQCIHGNVRLFDLNTRHLLYQILYCWCKLLQYDVASLCSHIGYMRRWCAIMRRRPFWSNLQLFYLALSLFLLFNFHKYMLIKCSLTKPKQHKCLNWKKRNH